jgi:hypothetical protein
MMKVGLVLVIALSLMGCDKLASKEVSPPPAASSDFGRWIVVPASNEPTTLSGSTFWSAWRLDTKTGDLEFCSYTPHEEALAGGAVSGATAHDILGCSTAAKAHPSD